MAKKTKPVPTLKNYSYDAEFEHGGAHGEVQAFDDKDAQERVKAMYHGQHRDVGTDENGQPISEATMVTKVTVTPVKEP